MASKLPEDFFGRAAAATDEPEVVRSIVDRVPGFEGEDWVPYFGHQAARWEKRAAEFHATGAGEDEIDALRRASAYYSLAAYPVVDDEPRRWAYHRAQDTYFRRWEMAGTPVEVLTVPFAGKHLRVHVRRNKAHQRGERAPIILVIRGLDSTKEVSYWDDRSLLLGGAALVSVDFPGMGENDLPMTLNTEKMFQAILDALAPGGIADGYGLQSEGAVAMGLGFGGYWAYKLAAVDPRIGAAVSIGGPIHHSFTPSLWRIVRHFNEIAFLSRITRRALGPGYSGSVSSFVSKLSLVKSGLLARTTAPLLYVNGERDLAVSQRESQLIHRYVPATGQVTRTVELLPDCGHLAIEKLSSHVLPLCARWTAERWAENERGEPGKPR